MKIGGLMTTCNYPQGYTVTKCTHKVVFSFSHKLSNVWLHVI